MRYLTVLALLLLVPVAVLAAEENKEAAALPTATDLIKQWDALRYYNRDLGLQDFQADLNCNLYSGLVETRLGRKPQFKLYWRWPSHCKITIANVPEKLQGVPADVCAAMQSQAVYLIPKCFSDIVGHYQITIGLEKSGAGNVLTGQALDNENPVRSFNTYLDKEGKELKTTWLTTAGSNITRTVAGSTARDARQLITDLQMEVHHANGTTSKYAIHTDFAQVGRYWLPAVMSINYADRAPVVFVLGRYKVNTGLSESFFKERDGK